MADLSNLSDPTRELVQKEIRMFIGSDAFTEFITKIVQSKERSKELDNSIERSIRLFVNDETKSLDRDISKVKSVLSTRKKKLERIEDFLKSDGVRLSRLEHYVHSILKVHVRKNRNQFLQAEDRNGRSFDNIRNIREELDSFKEMMKSRDLLLKNVIMNMNHSQRKRPSETHIEIPAKRSKIENHYNEGRYDTSYDAPYDASYQNWPYEY